MLPSILVNCSLSLLSHSPPKLSLVVSKISISVLLQPEKTEENSFLTPFIYSSSDYPNCNSCYGQCFAGQLSSNGHLILNQSRSYGHYWASPFRLLGEWKQFPWEGCWSQDIKAMTLENVSFNDGNAQIYFKIYLAENSHSILKSRAMSCPYNSKLIR